MNIFVLDENTDICAEYHNDKHVVKMILESAQMLSTAVRSTGVDAGYKSTHLNHPCNIWVRESIWNWWWLFDLAYSLHNEWQYRFDHPEHKKHKSFEVILSLPEPKLPDLGLTPFAQAMPDEYKSDDAVEAYRNYYMNEKDHLAGWKKRNKPEWYK